MKGLGRVGDTANAPADVHGCKSCPHPVQGPAAQGSPDVRVNGLPALRVGDRGAHSGCCGSNQWEAATGAATVRVNGRGVHRLGDITKHCGGVGALVQGSPNVRAGDRAAPVSVEPTQSWVEFRLRMGGLPAQPEPSTYVDAEGNKHTAAFDVGGRSRLESVARGEGSFDE